MTKNRKLKEAIILIPTGVYVQIAGTLALSGEKVQLVGGQIRLVPGGGSLRGKSGSPPLKHTLFHLSPATDSTGHLTTSQLAASKKHFMRVSGCTQLMHHPAALIATLLHLVYSFPPITQHPASHSSLFTFLQHHQMSTLHCNLACKLLSGV